MSQRTPDGWGKIRAQVRTLEPDDLVSLVRDLFDLSADNKRFLRARFLGSASSIEDYRLRIAQAVFPDPLGNRPVRIAEAEQLIRHFRQSTSDPVGTVDLLLTFVEEGTEQAADLGYGDERYFAALLRAVDSIIDAFPTLPKPMQTVFWTRLHEAQQRGTHIGWGYGDDLRRAVARIGPSGPTRG
jgi:hypothetical protein